MTKETFRESALSNMQLDTLVWLNPTNRSWFYPAFDTEAQLKDRYLTSSPGFGVRYSVENVTIAVTCYHPGTSESVEITNSEVEFYGADFVPDVLRYYRGHNGFYYVDYAPVVVQVEAHTHSQKQLLKVSNWMVNLYLKERTTTATPQSLSLPHMTFSETASDRYPSVTSTIIPTYFLPDELGVQIKSVSAR